MDYDSRCNKDICREGPWVTFCIRREKGKLYQQFMLHTNLPPAGKPPLIVSVFTPTLALSLSIEQKYIMKLNNVKHQLLSLAECQGFLAENQRHS